tara:strand:- start:950 stop:1309 length:360 start_codon:yes stop_codon:yes gene_type:complete
MPEKQIVIDSDFFVFLCQLDTQTRDLLVFQNASFSWADLCSMEPEDLLWSGLEQSALADLRFAMAQRGLVLLNDDLGAVKDVIKRMRGCADLATVQAICNTAIKLIDSIRPAAEAAPQP